MNFADAAHSMKVALVLFVALGAVVLAEAYRTPTPTPAPKPKPTPKPTPPRCPDSCPPSPRYVCAKDRRGNVYRFRNGCYRQMCACKMWLQPVSECSRDAPGCPVKDTSDESVSDSSSSSDSSSTSSDSHDDDDHGHGDVHGHVHGDVHGHVHGHGHGHTLHHVHVDTESIKKQAHHTH